MDLFQFQFPGIWQSARTKWCDRMWVPEFYLHLAEHWSALSKAALSLHCQ